MIRTIVRQVLTMIWPPGNVHYPFWTPAVPRVLSDMNCSPVPFSNISADKADKHIRVRAERHHVSYRIYIFYRFKSCAVLHPTPYLLRFSFSYSVACLCRRSQYKAMRSTRRKSRRYSMMPSHLWRIQFRQQIYETYLLTTYGCGARPSERQRRRNTGRSLNLNRNCRTR